MGFMRHGVQNPALLSACREIGTFRKRKWLPFGETRIIRGDKNHGKEADVNDSTAAYRLREQLKKFVGIVFPHAPKQQKEFLGQMLFGIQAGQTAVLSRIARELDEDILLKKTEERLSRHLLAEGLDATVQDAVLALVGFPMYVCSTASIPIAASLIAKGVSPGAAFVFLMVGPAMNAMSLTTVAALVGRKAAAAYVAVIIVGAILCGIAINLLPDALPASAAIAASGHSLSVVHWASAAFLAIMMAYNMVRPVAMGHRKCSSK